MIEFSIPYPKNKSAWSKRFGFNRFYAGVPWQVRKHEADFWHQLVVYTLREQGFRKHIIGEPVSLVFFFNDRLDCSNHAVYVKFIEDALKGFFLEDDSRKYVKSITMAFHDKDEITVQIRKAPE